MASFPGFTLEDFVQDVYWYSGESYEDMIARYEPLRERVETLLDMYEEETQSWRDYRYMIQERMEEELELNEIKL